MRKLLGFLGISSLIFGLWAFIHFTPVPRGLNIDNLWAATSIYPKDNTTFITVPFIFRGAQVKDRHLTTDSGLTNAEGDRYIVAATGADTWLNHTNHITEYHKRTGTDTSVYFYDPPAGYQVYVTDEATVYVFNGTSWVTTASLIPDGVIVDTMIYDTAAINATKIADGTVTNTEFQYINSVTSNAQTQLNGKQTTITGGASTVTDTNLTVQRALISNASGKIAVSTVTDTILGYLDATSSIQSQINGKEPSVSTGADTNVWHGNKTFSPIVEYDLALSDTTVGNVSTAKHGFVPKGTGAGTTYLKDDGTWATPAGSGGTLATLTDVILTGTAQGDILYVDTDHWKNLGAGVSGKYLKTQGAAANPIWDTPAGGGDMLRSDYAIVDTNIVDTAFQLKITGQVAGDVLYYDGSIWTKLAKDIGKYLKSGTSAVSWDTPAGSTMTDTMLMQSREYIFYADEVSSPNNGDWGYNGLAPAEQDNVNTALVIRSFDQTDTEGVGFSLTIPSTTTSFVIKLLNRCKTYFASKYARLRLYYRKVTLAGVVAAWSNYALSDITFTDTYFKNDTQSFALTLPTTDLVAGQEYQFELAREKIGGSTNLDTDLYIRKITATFQ